MATETEIEIHFRGLIIEQIPIGLPILALPLKKLAFRIPNIRFADRSVFTYERSGFNAVHVHCTSLHRYRSTDRHIKLNETNTWSWNPTLALSSLSKQSVSICLLSIPDRHQNRWLC